MCHFPPTWRQSFIISNTNTSLLVMNSLSFWLFKNDYFSPLLKDSFYGFEILGRSLFSPIIIFHSTLFMHSWFPKRRILILFSMGSCGPLSRVSDTFLPVFGFLQFKYHVPRCSCPCRNGDICSFSNSLRYLDLWFDLSLILEKCSVIVSPNIFSYPFIGFFLTF